MDQSLLLIAVDLVAIAVLVFGLYFPRHRRRDLVVAYLTVNVGVLAVALVLGQTAVGAGLGLGLFGVLSIIRLRSREIEQHEVAYYFAALALGLIGGLVGTASWLGIGLMALVLVVLAIGDHPALFRRSRQQSVVLDQAIADEHELTARLEQVLGGRVLRVRVEQLDLVDDTTKVDVRFEAPRAGAARPGATRSGATRLGATRPGATRPATAGSDAATPVEARPAATAERPAAETVSLEVAR
ncbi:DUF4956 domain-containing protein [Agromyces larvae]|uniref:DUF4956 domain-containing protein n=1 Tax=Agromyces larvae TaxID=2929802 RepID=A0ABY4BUR5_9MICO|nr:DUF4956 domain-containing protein [Agromyces larvae]UOE42953.1 DUF4956 domain-containing protein [Agromyces larvae]